MKWFSRVLQQAPFSKKGKMGKNPRLCLLINLVSGPKKSTVLAD